MLHKTLSEIRALPSSEITTWLAFMKLKAKKPEEKPKSDLESFRKMISK